jgi:hypothetical protein
MGGGIIDTYICVQREKGVQPFVRSYVLTRNDFFGWSGVDIPAFTRIFAEHLVSLKPPDDSGLYVNV